MWCRYSGTRIFMSRWLCAAFQGHLLRFVDTVVLSAAFARLCLCPSFAGHPSKAFFPNFSIQIFVVTFSYQYQPTNFNHTPSSPSKTHTQKLRCPSAGEKLGRGLVPRGRTLPKDRGRETHSPKSSRPVHKQAKNCNSATIVQ